MTFSDGDGMVMTPVISIEPEMNWAYDALLRKWVNTETGEVRASSPSECGEDSPEDYPQARIVEGDAFFLTPQQIRAGTRLAIDETTGDIRACPGCGKRQVVGVCGFALGFSPILQSTKVHQFLQLVFNLRLFCFFSRAFRNNQNFGTLVLHPMSLPNFGLINTESTHFGTLKRLWYYFNSTKSLRL